MVLKPSLVLLSCLTAVFSIPASASVISNTGKSLTYGSVSGEASLIGTRFNPASASLAASHLKEAQTVGGEFSGGAGMEYGNVQELFDKVDELAEYFVRGGSGGSGDGVEVEDSIDINNPQLDVLIDAVAARAAKVTSLLAVVAAEGYARANIDGQFSLVLNKDISGGHLAFDYVSSLSAGVAGIVDQIEFDPQTALDELQSAYNIDPLSPRTTFDLSGGLQLTVDPASGSTSVAFDNDSLLLTRASQIEEFTFSYSNSVGDFANGTLYWGLAPKVVQVGLSNIAYRIGDLSDSESIFEDARDAELESDTALGLNVGILWVADNYNLGLKVTDILENTFTFPELDTSNFTNPELIEAAERSREYKLKRQIGFEGGVTSSNKRWSFNTSIDANAINDIFGFDYQWFTASAAYHPNTWVVPDLRFGFRHNLAGSGISYLGGGITFLKYLNLDISVATDTVVVEGDEFPRGADATLGFSYAF